MLEQNERRCPAPSADMIRSRLSMQLPGVSGVNNKLGHRKSCE